MNNPLSFSVYACIATSLCSSIASVAHADFLQLSASTPDVTVSTRRSERNFIRLPELQYEFLVQARCPANLEPESVSLSIADTRVSNAGFADSDEVRLTVRIPAGQLAPLKVDGFCLTVQDGDDRGTEPVRIAAVLSAQAALLCASDTDRKMSYASESLDLIIRCDRPAPEPAIETD